ncbi:hypothetical protein [Paenibacillus harenae]|nr:hypothetical protein [Paenibacillus harenae]
MLSNPFLFPESISAEEESYLFEVLRHIDDSVWKEIVRKSDMS